MLKKITGYIMIITIILQLTQPLVMNADGFFVSKNSTEEVAEQEEGTSEADTKGIFNIASKKEEEDEVSTFEIKTKDTPSDEQVVEESIVDETESDSENIEETEETVDTATKEQEEIEVEEENNTVNEETQISRVFKMFSSEEAQKAYNILLDSESPKAILGAELGLGEITSLENVVNPTCNTLANWCGLNQDDQEVVFPSPGTYILNYSTTTRSNEKFGIVIPSPTAFVPLPPEEKVEGGTFFASGNKYYQAPDSNGVGTEYGYYDGTYYVTPTDKKIDVFGQAYEIGTDLLENIGPNGTGIKPELCPYVKDEDYLDNNIPNNPDKHTCDYATTEFGQNVVDNLGIEIYHTVTGDGSGYIYNVTEGRYEPIPTAGTAETFEGDEPGTEYEVPYEVVLPLEQLLTKVLNIPPRIAGSIVSNIDNNPLLVSGCPLGTTGSSCTGTATGPYIFHGADTSNGQLMVGSIHSLHVKLVDEQQMMALDDLQIHQRLAPQNEKSLIDSLDPEMVEVENIIDGHMENHIGEEITGIENFEVVNDGGYNYDNPKPGLYGIDVMGRSPYTGQEVIESCTVEVLPDYTDTAYDADLTASSPVAVASSASGYDILEATRPLSIEYDNYNFVNAVDEIEDEDEDLQIIQNDLLTTGDGDRRFYKLETSYNGMTAQTIIEAQLTGDNDPITDEITMTGIDTVVLSKDEKINPVKSTNTHAYNSEGDELDVNVAYSQVNKNTEGDYQVVLDAENDDAYGVKKIDVNLQEVNLEDMPLIAASDAKERSSFAPDNAEEIIDLMGVKAIDTDGEDITDLVEVFNKDDFTYGDGQTTGTPYEITLGVTSPTTNVTTTVTRDLSIIGNGEKIPAVEMVSNEPVYVKLDDDISLDELTSIIDPDVLLYMNSELEDVVPTDIELLNGDVFNTNAPGEYYLLYEGTYDEPKSEIDSMTSSNIFEVIVDEDVETTQAQISITTDEEVNLVVGDEFDPMTTPNVKATSMTDGDITDKVEVLSNSVDTTKAGEYPVSYKVEDSEGHTAYQNVMVNVYDSEEDLEADKEDDNSTTDEDNSTSTTNGDSNDSTGSLSTDSAAANEETATLTNTTTTSFEAMFITMTALTAAYVLVSKKIIK